MASAAAAAATASAAISYDVQLKPLLALLSLTKETCELQFSVAHVRSTTLVLGNVAAITWSLSTSGAIFSKPSCSAQDDYTERMVLDVKTATSALARLDRMKASRHTLRASESGILVEAHNSAGKVGTVSISRIELPDTAASLFDVPDFINPFGVDMRANAIALSLAALNNILINTGKEDLELKTAATSVTARACNTLASVEYTHATASPMAAFAAVYSPSTVNLMRSMLKCVSSIGGSGSTTTAAKRARDADSSAATTGTPTLRLCFASPLALCYTTGVDALHVYVGEKLDDDDDDEEDQGEDE